MAIADEKEGAKRLTPEQIENWRKILVGMIGPYALLMSDEEIEILRNKMQARIDRMEGRRDHADL